MVLKNTKNVPMSKFYKTFPRTVFTESNLFLINHTWYNRWYTSQVLTTRQYRHLLSNGTLKPVELAEEVLEAKVRNSIHHLQLFQWIPASRMTSKGPWPFVVAIESTPPAVLSLPRCCALTMAIPSMWILKRRQSKLLAPTYICMCSSRKWMWGVCCLMKQNCYFQRGVAECRHAATPLSSYSINTTLQGFQKRYSTLFYLNGLKSYQPSKFKCLHFTCLHSATPLWI